MPKSNLYTRTGDTGTTSLIGGARVAKDSLRLNAYGSLDELSAFIGVIVSDPACLAEEKNRLMEVQNMLFNIGCYLATPLQSGEKTQATDLDQDDMQKMEEWIDKLDEQTPPVRAFILPGGSPLAAKTHVARTVCRRAERNIITLASEEYVDPLVIAYINRFSDYLFILSRYFNFMEGIPEITWKRKEKN